MLTYTTNISRVATVQDGMNRTRTLEHDDLDRVTKITYNDGSFVQFVYDKDGNLTAQNDSTNGNSTVTYDQLSRVATNTKQGVTTTYTYDASSNLTTIQDPGGTTSYGYDAANQNKCISEPGVTACTAPFSDANTIRMEYDDDGLRTKTTYPNGVSVLAENDDANRITDIYSSRSSTPTKLNAFQRYSYTWENASGIERALRQSTTDHGTGRITAYDYDDLNRLQLSRVYTGTTVPACASALACYDPELDAVGNRTSLSVRGTAITNSDTTWAYNDANQLCWKKNTAVTLPTCGTVPSGASVYTHDADGNQTSNGTRALVYNNRDQTTSIAGTSASYLGTGQADATAYGTTSLRNDLVGPASRTVGGTTSNYTRAIDGTIVAQRTGTAREYYSHDILGSVTATTTNATGAPTAATYAYDPDGNATTTGSSTNPFKYVSGYSAPGGLTHFGQRYYDSADARWTQVDPLDQTGDLLDGNRYGYVGGDPINLTDPSGQDGSSAGCSAGPVSVSGSRNDDDSDSGGRIAFSFGGGIGCSGSRYGGESGRGASVSGEVCVVVCAGASSDSGISVGLGVKVSASIDIGIDF